MRYSIAMDVPHDMMPTELTTTGGSSSSSSSSSSRGLLGGGGGGGRGGATLRKFKAGGAKCHFSTVLGAPEEVDVRLKLLAQYREHQVSECVGECVRACVHAWVDG